MSTKLGASGVTAGMKLHRHTKQAELDNMKKHEKKSDDEYNTKSKLCNEIDADIEKNPTTYFVVGGKSLKGKAS